MSQQDRSKLNRVWRPIWGPGLNSPRPNRHSNTDLSQSKFYSPSSNGSTGKRITVLRPHPFNSLTRDPPFGVASSTRASPLIDKSDSFPGFGNHGFFMRSRPTTPNQEEDSIPSYQQLDKSKKGSWKSRASSPSYMSYDDDLFDIKYSSSEDLVQQEKPLSTYSNWGDDTDPDISDRKKQNVLLEFCQETGFDGLKHAGNNRLSLLMR